MEKIKELLEKIGASEELANALCEHLEHYSNDLKAQFDRDLKEKVEKAKQICIEEVAREKVNLARKVQIFLESKAKGIEQAMAKQRVAEDTEATAKLKKAKALLEDIDIEGGATSRELLALQKKAERLEKAFGTVREERDRAVQRANRANGIAVKVLKKNQVMESTLRENGLITEGKGGEATCECAGGGTLGEAGKCSKCQKPMKEAKESCEKCKKPGNLCKCGETATEGKKKGKKTIAEGKKRLDGSRKKLQKPKSTRRTLVESEIPAGPYMTNGSPDITKIATQMPED
jgi:hypothetical protein